MLSLAQGQTVTQVLDASGDGVHPLTNPVKLALDGQGNLYVAGRTSNNVFRVEPDGTIRQILGPEGDGQGNVIDRVRGVAVDHQGSVYASSFGTNSLFRVDPDGTVTRIMNPSADGVNPFVGAYDVVVDTQRNAYVAGRDSDNVFRVALDGVVTMLMDASGDGVHAMDAPINMTFDSVGNLYVGAEETDNVFRIGMDGTVEEVAGDTPKIILGLLGDVAVDMQGSIFFTGQASYSAYKKTVAGQTSSILTWDEDHFVAYPNGIAVDAAGNAYVACYTSDNVWRVSPNGAIQEILTADGDGQGNPSDGPWEIVVDGAGNVFVACIRNHRVFRIEGCGAIPATATPRNGSGANPAGFTETAPALLGGTWTAQVDLAAAGLSTTSGAVASLVAVGTGPTPPIPGPFGELLCLPPFHPRDVATGEHAFPIPFDCTLAGRTLALQAATIDLAPLRIRLQNALDVTVGTQ